MRCFLKDADADADKDADADADADAYMQMHMWEMETGEYANKRSCLFLIGRHRNYFYIKKFIPEGKEVSSIK